MKTLWFALGCVLAACGCGGGGGGGDSGGASWLTFEPASIAVTSYQGEPALTVSLVATSTKTINEVLEAGLVFDRADVFDAASTEIDALGMLQYQARFHTVAGLAPGVYAGTIEVRLCRDSPTACSDPYPGSPWHVPYRIEVKAAPTAPVAVTNGDFSDGMTGWRTWTMNGASATAAVNGGVLEATVASGGTGYADAQVIYDGGGLALIGGKTYRLSFKASGSPTGRSIEVTVWENGRDLDGAGFAWSSYDYQHLTLTPTMATYTSDFTMPYTNADAGLAFFIGGSTTGVRIDEVSLVEVP